MCLRAAGSGLWDAMGGKYEKANDTEGILLQRKNTARCAVITNQDMGIYKLTASPAL